MNFIRQLRNEPSSPFNEIVAKFIEKQNRMLNLDGNLGDSLHSESGEDVNVQDDTEHVDTFGGFTEASAKIKEGLSELLLRLNKRLDTITNDMIRTHLKEMTAETEKQILSDGKIQREIAEKIHQLEEAFEMVLHIDGLAEPVNELETSDETSGDVGDDLFESIDDTSATEGDVTECSNFSTDADSQDEFVQFEDTAFSRKCREVLPAPPAISRKTEEGEQPPSSSRPQECPTAAAPNRIVGPDGTSLDQRSADRFEGICPLDPYNNQLIQLTIHYGAPPDISATQRVGYPVPEPQFPPGAPMPGLAYPVYFNPTYNQCQGCTMGNE